MLKNRLTDFFEKLVEKWDYMVYNEARNSENAVVIPILRGIDAIHMNSLKFR